MPQRSDRRSVVERVREATDFEALVGERAELKRSGRRLVALCPFHDENTPSFGVDAEAKIWYCHGACRTGGDLFDYVVRAGLAEDFWEAVRYLADRAGLRLADLSPEEKRRWESERAVERGAREALRAVVEAARGAFSGSPAETLLRERGFEPLHDGVLEAAWVGYVQSVEQVRACLGNRPQAYLDAAGIWLVGDAAQKLWRQRLCIPIVRKHSVVNLCLRSVDANPLPSDKWRYLHERPKGLWGWDERHEGRPLVIAEAALDALALRCAGRPAAVATLGTPGVEEAHRVVRDLRDCEGPITLCLDCDEDATKGQAAALRLATEFARRGKRTRIVDLQAASDEKGKADAAEVLRRRGATVLADAVLKGVPPLVWIARWNLRSDHSLMLRDGSGYVLEAERGDYRCPAIDSKDPAGVRAVVEYARNDATVHRDQLPLWSSMRRRQFATACAATLVDKAAATAEQARIEHELLALQDELHKALAEELEQAAGAQDAPDMTDEEREEAEALLRSPRLLPQINDDVRALGVIGEEVNAAAAYIAMTSRLMDRPLYLCFKGQTSAGKSFLLDTVCTLCPPEQYVQATRITANALFYQDSDFLKHKMFVISERAGGEGADYSIRALLSERGLTLHTVGKDHDGTLRTQIKVLEGPMAYAETTTALEFNVENESRLLELYMDETPEQTAAIQVVQRRRALLSYLEREDELEALVRRHRNAQRLLEQVRVVIPWAEALEFPVQFTRHRRDHEKLLGLIQAIAFLRQRQKEVKELARPDGEVVRYVEADYLDYCYAHGMASLLFVSTLDEVDPRARRLHGALVDLCRRKEAQRSGLPLTDALGWVKTEELLKHPFTLTEAANAVGMQRRTTEEMLTLLEEHDYVRMDGHEGAARTWALVTSDQRKQEVQLLPLEALKSLIEIKGG